MTVTCTRCHRTLLTAGAWLALTAEKRREIRTTHARHKYQGTCAACYTANRKEAEIKWTGGWVNDRGVMRPVGPRPVDGEAS